MLVAFLDIVRKIIPYAPLLPALSPPTTITILPYIIEGNSLPKAANVPRL